MLTPRQLKRLHEDARQEKLSNFYNELPNITKACLYMLEHSAKAGDTFTSLYQLIRTMDESYSRLNITREAAKLAADHSDLVKNDLISLGFKFNGDFIFFNEQGE